MSNVRKIVHVQPPSEVDLATVDAFASRLEIAIAQAPDVLVVDFTHVEFVGAVGVELLRDFQEALAQQGGRLRIAHANWQVRLGFPGNRGGFGYAASGWRAAVSKLFGDSIPAELCRLRTL